MTSKTVNRQHPAPLAMNSLLQKPRYLIFVAIGLLILATIVWFNTEFGLSVNATTDTNDEARKLPVSVTTARLVNSITQKRTYTGTIRPKHQSSLGFELTGRIDAVHCDEGDIVTLNQSLATLDKQSLEAQAAAVKASLTQAQAVLAELEAGPRAQTIDSMQAQLAEAESNLKLAELTLQRREKLKQTNSVSQSEFDSALYSQQAANARVESLSQRLSELQAGTRIEKINAQKAAVAQLNSSLHEIEIQIQKSNLLAPFSGKIVSRMIDPGAIATASMPVLKIVDSENLEAVIGLPVETAKSLAIGKPYQISIANRVYDSRLTAKIQELDAATRSQNLIFKLEPNTTSNVIPGELCQIEVETQIDSQGYWVPSTALSNGIRGLWTLMVVDPESSRAVRCDVEIVYTDGERALVRGTLESGAKIIVDGGHRFVEGQLVSPINKQVQP